jgi:5-formyltetrahydrofolate cyclo-ligase
MNKEELRKIYRNKRLALTNREHQELSQNLADLFFQSVDLSNVKTLHIFLPIESKREPNTWLIIERIRKEFPHIRLVIPKVTGEMMEHIFFEGDHQLEKTKWGMVEPKQGTKAEAKEMDMVIVPLLAIDKQGHRIGYGKGYYDRFLLQCRDDCKKIGISFFENEMIIEEKSISDITLNACITPNEFLLF